MKRKPAADMSGQRYNRLTVVSRAGVDAHERATWLCRCDCSNELVVPWFRLRQGHTKSCGCLKAELARARVTTHGKSRSPTHNSWVGMIQRCGYTKHAEYQRYGGRGIKVCERWKSFENFLADMGERPSGTTIDRIDSDGDYEPANCRWATNSQQASNRRSSILIERDGRTQTVRAWCSELGINPDVIYGRLRRGAPKDGVFDGL